MNPFCLFDNIASSVWLAAAFSASAGPSLSSCAAKKTSLGADCRVFHPPVQHLKETRLGKGKLRLKISWNGNKILFFFVLKMGRPDHKKTFKDNLR